MREFDCRSEIRYLLHEIGDPNPDARETGIPGLVIAKTTMDPFEAVRKLRALAEERPWEFRYTLKVIPIEVVVDTDFNKIVEAAQELANTKIKQDESYRVTINKRFTTIDRRELIEAIAAGINRKVNLEHPDRIVEVEILGRITGISVLNPEDILSIAKLKRRLGTE